MASKSRMLFAFVTVLSLAGIKSAVAQVTSQLPANDLVKAVIRHELAPASNREIRWKYVLAKQSDGKQEIRQVVETRSGSLDRLISVQGRPLSDGQKRVESDRILRISHDAAEQGRMEQARRKDAEQCNAFLTMIPDAFLFDYAGQSGTLTKLTFKPNPQFRASTREGKVLREMQGEIWVDARQQRLAVIRGQLMNDGGLLGHLLKGGQFNVRREEIAAGDWEMTEMQVDMHGKALLFKAISVQQKETHSNFQRVPDDLDLAQAAGILLNETTVAAKR
jgi:hypothetical protein